MHRARRILLAVLISAGAFAGQAVGAPHVEFELITAAGFPITGAQKWIQALKDLPDISVQIRGGRSGEQTKIENVGTDATPRYHVVGILDASSQLKVPGGSFRTSDMASLAKWLEKLRAGGESAPTEQTAVFGLTAKELLALNDALSGKVASETAGRRAGDVARELTRAIQLEVSVDRSARPAFAGEETVGDELRGMTTGTALAAVLRPLGLVLTAERTAARQTRLIITRADQAKEFWPVGWPPQDADGRVAPNLFKFLNVEINDTPLAESVAAIQARMEMPFLYDYNALARRRVDPATFRVSLPETRTYYKRILDRLLNQARLTSEVRLDETGQPFVWISSL